MIPYGHQWIDREDVDAVIHALTSDWLTTGPLVPDFEKKLCSYTGGNEAITVNSGTSALDIALQALDLAQNSEVITTPFTFAATSNAILYNGLKPVFADIQRNSRNIDPDSIRDKITSKTKAIVYVDYAGHPCEINEIKEIAIDNDLYLIEDACHALGSSYRGKKVGDFADISVFSFHPVKPITTGEGGAAVTSNPCLASRMRLLRNHGIDKNNVNPSFGGDCPWMYDMTMLGRNYRMTDIQAALGISQLKKIDSFIKKRNVIAKSYLDKLQDITYLNLPVSATDIIHGWHLFTVLLKGNGRDALFKYMQKSGIGVNVHYIPVYRLSYYRKNLPINISDYPVAEDVFSKIITLPLYPAMTDGDVDSVVDALFKWSDN